MEKSTNIKEGTEEERTRIIAEQQKKKLLQVFFVLKKLKVSFKTTMFLALVKTPASTKDLDKWAFIFRSTHKLPFKLVELQTFTDMAKDQLGDLPITVEAKKILFEVEKGKKKEECFAITFEVNLK